MASIRFDSFTTIHQRAAKNAPKKGKQRAKSFSVDPLARLGSMGKDPEILKAKETLAGIRVSMTVGKDHRDLCDCNTTTFGETVEQSC